MKKAKTTHVLAKPHVMNVHREASRVIKGRDESGPRHTGVLIDMSDKESKGDPKDEDFEQY